MKTLRALRQDPGLLDRAACRAETIPLDEIESWCIFVGHPRSGHSLVGSLIDAQPDAVAAHELDLLGLVAAGHDDPRLLAAACEERSAWFRRHEGRWGEHTYLVENGWQGRVRRRRLVGDKKGGRTTLRLGRDPELLERFQEIVGVPIWIIHVARHPLDNIATMAERRGVTLDQGIDDFLNRARTVNTLRARWPADRWVEIDQATFCRATESSLATALGRLLGDYDAEVTASSAALVDSEPRRSRSRVHWNPSQIKRVQNGLDGIHSYARILDEETWKTS